MSRGQSCGNSMDIPWTVTQLVLGHNFLTLILHHTNVNEIIHTFGKCVGINPAKTACPQDFPWTVPRTVTWTVTDHTVTVTVTIYNIYFDFVHRMSRGQSLGQICKCSIYNCSLFSKKYWNNPKINQ